MILSFEQFNQQIPNYLAQTTPDHIIWIFSQTTHEFCASKIEPIHPSKTIIIDDGEKAKSLTTAAEVWQLLIESNCTRKSLIIAVGGGTLLDLAGFCASTFMRGVDIIYVPTTLLAMVDSAEGGKTGINFNGTKNMIGTFQKPVLNLIVPSFLTTLPYNELLSGWAEVIKHMILVGNDLTPLCSNGIPEINSPLWPEIIEKNIRFKQNIVDQDFKENGLRKTLNLGHSIGHALESLRFNDKTINHGIAVANGIVIEALIAFKMQLSSQTFYSQIEKIIFPLFPKITFSHNEIPQIIEFLEKDKKNNHNRLLFSLPIDFGNVTFNTQVSKEIIAEVLSHWAL